MKTINRLILFLTLFLLLALPAGAARTVAKGAADSASDQQLTLKYNDFMQFARNKVKDLNRNHKFSRSRMQISKQPDGTYRALYHQIENSELVGTVRRSSSKSVPFVGILSYQEQVFESYGKTPEACKQGDFSLISIIPNKHIFSYKKGLWN